MLIKIPRITRMCWNSEKQKDVKKKVYPYGTKLELEGDTIKAIRADKLSAGDIVKIEARAKVVSKRESVDADTNDIDGNSRMEIQLTSIKIIPDTNKTLTGALYGEED